ncbi:MAG TPA: acetyl-CoA carboxylase biotin carboxylase subunit [Candidatus Margulisiibacteriota bacterium]|nr:acetyl-CoA carboxylase biotin carboxylase subunit [Candidatus Margulisiibacteriota bacterium]
MVHRVLIANRGEIAIRIMRACREAGSETVAVFSEADARAPHVVQADRAVCIGPPPSSESYLNIPRIIDAARSSGADAIHPGYGFLAENAAFAQAVEDAGLVFIGPSADVIAAMGDKTLARRTVAAAGVPVVPADDNPLGRGPAQRREASATTADERASLIAAAARLGYPLLIKAAAGGGGKGMRVVREASALEASFQAAAREALAAFGDDRLFLERYVERPRHVEVQVLADHHGNIVHLGERECSIQRRHQKLIEETPSPAVDATLRGQMTDAAVAAARSVGYRNAGTVEFLLAPDGAFYFLEMNTRLQVEHAITEWTTGIDLVHAQLRIAAGERLWVRQEDIAARGHAIECRICAEDPAQQFLPRPGRIMCLREPQGPAIRVDSGIAAGFDVPIYYDPLLAKVSVWGETRETARRRMIAALADYVILGCTTSIPFLLDVLEHQAFVRGETHTHFIEDHFPTWTGREQHRVIAAIAAAINVVRRPHVAHAGHQDGRAVASPWTTLGHWRLGQGG